MELYDEVEKKLAELEGWTDVRVYCNPNTGETCYIGHPPSDSFLLNPIPRYCREWGAAGPLLIDHGLELNHCRHWEEDSARKSTGGYAPVDCIEIRKCRKASEEYGHSPLIVSIPRKNHPDMHTATRYAITVAVIELYSKFKDPHSV